ncbi:helix-turn-helix domain-containing protein, partial [Actinoallomurus sp. NPDC052274]|uniref:PucR family transcriptional regulator n=1 Tax=Actinoallomurus sp. NPDC052274 TaxID=3155420 RepID=UPI00342C0E31
VVLPGALRRGRRAGPARRQAAARRRPAPAPPETVNGIRFLWRLRADAHLAVVDLGDAGLDDLTEVLRAYACHHVGLSPVVDSPADLGHARWLAELALRTCRSPRAEVARLDRRLPAALVVSQPELAEHLRRSVLDGLTALDPVKRGLLLETLDAWLECGGSATAAARRLYCHPNTVLNRLRTLERLSGRSSSRPLELVELVLARHALHEGDKSPG